MVSKFTDRITKYLTKSAERKTTRASKSKGSRDPRKCSFLISEMTSVTSNNHIMISEMNIVTSDNLIVDIKNRHVY